MFTSFDAEYFYFVFECDRYVEIDLFSRWHETARFIIIKIVTQIVLKRVGRLSFFLLLLN